MRFKKFYQINELFNNWTYYVPKSDKRYMLFDFYALSLVYPDNLDDMNMKIAFKEAKEKITDQLIEDFKYALFYSLSAEFRHVGGEEPEHEWGFRKEELVEGFFDSIGELSFAQKFIKKISTTTWTRDDAFKILNSMNIPPKKMADIFEKTFNGPLFVKTLGPNYGGNSWAMIAEAWGKLYTVSGLGNKMVLIDHIYDLQHNSGSVFTKVKEYYKNGHTLWLKAALDFKRNIKEPFALYNMISPDLQDPFAYVLKMQSGITLQTFKERNLDIGEYRFIRKDLKRGNVYGNVKFYEFMNPLKGKLAKIIEINNNSGDNIYYIDFLGRDYGFSFEMFSDKLPTKKDIGHKNGILKDQKKLEPGFKIHIRKDLILNMKYGEGTAFTDHIKFSNKWLTVRKIHVTTDTKNYFFGAKENEFIYFSSEMVDKYKKAKRDFFIVGDMVKVLKVTNNIESLIYKISKDIGHDKDETKQMIDTIKMLKGKTIEIETIYNSFGSLYRNPIIRLSSKSMSHLFATYFPVEVLKLVKPAKFDVKMNFWG